MKGDLTERGQWQHCDDQSLTVAVDGERHVFHRADVREVYVSAEGLSTTVQPIDAEALVYQLPPCLTERGRAVAQVSRVGAMLRNDT